MVCEIRPSTKKGVKCPGRFSVPAGGSKNRILTRGPKCGPYAFWAIAHRKIWIICDFFRYGSQKSIIRQKSYSDFSIDFSEIFEDFPKTHFNKTEDVYTTARYKSWGGWIYSTLGEGTSLRASGGLPQGPGAVRSEVPEAHSGVSKPRRW